MTPEIEALEHQKISNKDVSLRFKNFSNFLRGHRLICSNETN